MLFLFSPPLSKFPRRNRGAATIEFGLVVIALLLLVIGVIQFGLIYFTTSAVNNGAREGARYGAVNPTKIDATQADSIQATVKNRTGGVNRRLLDVSVSFPDGAAKPSDRIKVTATYPISPFFPVCLHLIFLKAP